MSDQRRPDGAFAIHGVAHVAGGSKCDPCWSLQTVGDSFPRLCNHGDCDGHEHAQLKPGGAQDGASDRYTVTCDTCGHSYEGIMIGCKVHTVGDRDCWHCQSSLLRGTSQCSCGGVMHSDDDWSYDGHEERHVHWWICERCGREEREGD